jgi:hypothetical protein
MSERKIGQKGEGYMVREAEVNSILPILVR